MQIISNSFESGLIFSLLERHSKNLPFNTLLQQLHQSAHECCAHYARICTSAPLLPVIQRDPHLIEQETNLAMCTLWDRVNHWQIIHKQTELTDSTHQLLKVDQVIMEGLVPFMDEGDI